MVQACRWGGNVGDGKVCLHFSGCTGTRTSFFFVKKLSKQQLIPAAAINRANSPVFGLWQEIGSLVAGARCSTLRGGGWVAYRRLPLERVAPGVFLPAALCLPRSASECPTVEASARSHWHSLLRERGQEAPSAPFSG